MKIKIIRLLLFIIVIFSSISYAQGVLQGVVRDSVTNEGMIGANVILIGTAQGSSADLEGFYRISRIPDGNYRVKVSYIGYKPKEFDVTISSNKTTLLNVSLVPDVIVGTEIVITAQAVGQAAAINQQLSANTIVNVVSEQKIQELPDANAAESIGRLPGVSLLRSGGEASQIVLRGLAPKFTTITVDGVKINPTNANDRGVDLSTISQGSLAGIELFKALTSDKDGEALAGTVNLVTRKAPESRYIKIETKGNYNKLEKSLNQYNVIGKYGERFFDGLLGMQVNANLEKIIRSSENINYNYVSINNLTDWNYNSLILTYSNEIRKRAGGSVIFDINTPDNGSIKFSNIYNETSRDWITHNRNYQQSGGIDYQYRDRKINISIYSTSLHGENYLFGFDLNWNLAFSQSKVKPLVDYQMTFSEPSTSVSGMKNVPAEYLKGPIEEWIPYAWNNFDRASLNTAYDRKSGNYDREKTALLDILRKYTLSNNITGEIKFGGKFRSKYRSHDEYEAVATYYLWKVPEYMRLPDGTYTKKDFTGTRFDGLINTSAISLDHFLDDIPEDRMVWDIYRLYPLINRDYMKLWRELNINGFSTPKKENFDTNAEYVVNNGTVANGYSLTERVFAGYMMNTLQFGSLITLITGARVEYDYNDYTCLYSPQKLGGFNWAPYGLLQEKSVNHKETVILPNLQMLIKATDFLNVRFAAYKALSRPDFNQRLPRFIAVAASSPYLRLGNPNLKNAEAWNFEVQTQFYGNAIGLFSINIFYKDIKNMHHTLSGIQVKGKKLVDSLGVNWQIFTDKFPFDESSQYNLTYTYNSSKPTRVWGFEVEHQANFRYLPGFLKNIVLDYNFTFVRSETWYTRQKDIEIPRPPFPPIRTKVLYDEKRKLEDQPEFRSNVSLGYDYKGFSIRVSYSYQGEFTRSFSSDSRSDGVTNKYSRWDIALTQKATDYLTCILNLNNISNTKEMTSIANRLVNWPLLTDVVNIYGFTVDFGLRVEL